MKKIIFIIFFILLLVIFILISKNNIKTTDLNNISINSIKIGNLISEVDLNQYTSTKKYLPENNTIHYEELSITYNDNNKIIKIRTNFISDLLDKINNKINEKDNISYIKQAIDTLGENYICKWYDREQKLKQIIYKDKINNLKVQFIFSDLEPEDKILTVIISSTNN